MIKVNRGEISIEGNVPDILSELSIAIKHIKKAFMENGYSKEAVDNMVSDAVRAADMTTDKMIEEIISKLSTLGNLFKQKGKIDHE